MPSLYHRWYFLFFCLPYITLFVILIFLNLLFFSPHFLHSLHFENRTTTILLHVFSTQFIARVCHLNSLLCIEGGIYQWTALCSTDEYRLWGSSYACRRTWYRMDCKQGKPTWTGCRIGTWQALQKLFDQRRVEIFWSFHKKSRSQCFLKTFPLIIIWTWA